MSCSRGTRRRCARCWTCLCSAVFPFDRKFAKTFDKGQPLLDPEYPTIQKYQEIVGRIQALLDYKKVLAEKL
jgi:hypothetical protein